MPSNFERPGGAKRDFEQAFQCPSTAKQARTSVSSAAAKPSGRDFGNAAVKPTGSVLTPTSAVLKLTGVVLELTGAVLKPTHTDLEPTGAVLEPTGAVVEPTGAVLQPTGAERCSGAHRRRSGSHGPGALKRCSATGCLPRRLKAFVTLVVNFPVWLLITFFSHWL